MSYKLPWYPWFLGDWLASPTREDMSAEERGIYRDTLDLLVQFGGSLEINRTKLERRLLVTPEEFERSFPATARQMRPDYEQTGFFVNDKVLRVIEKQQALHDQRSRAGLLGVEARRRKKRQN
jgi:hypothetical protein